MEYSRITNINDPLFKQMHQLMQDVFPPEEVLEFDLWKEPLEDPGIRGFVAVYEGKWGPLLSVENQVSTCLLNRRINSA